MSEDGRAKTEVSGDSVDVLFCLALLANNICDNFHAPISMFVVFLSIMAESSRAILKRSTKVDIGAIKKQLAALSRDGDPEKGDGKEHER